MTMHEMKTRQCLRRLNWLAQILFTLLAFVGSAAAQSTDLDHPTPMTTNEVKGRWPTGKGISYFFSFMGGPGEVRIMLDFTPDSGLENVAGQLTDAYGRPFASLDPVSGDLSGGTELYNFATTQGQRLVGRYAIKRRQKLVVKLSIPGDEIKTGRYKVRVEGDGVSFNDGSTAPANNTGSTDNPTNKTSAAGNRLPCLPASGKLRLVMDDGTVQEINLGRVREATVKP